MGAGIFAASLWSVVEGVQRRNCRGCCGWTTVGSVHVHPCSYRDRRRGRILSSYGVGQYPAIIQGGVLLNTDQKDVTRI